MSQVIEVKVPDIGDYKDVPVIDILISPGDTVEFEQPLVTLESDKATIDIPSPQAGKIKELKVQSGSRVSEGSLILLLEVEEAGSQPESAKPAQAAAPQATPPTETAPEKKAQPSDVSEKQAAPTASTPAPQAVASADTAVQAGHASPSVRQFARELGADIQRIAGSGPKGRITKEDVQAYIKQILSQTQAGSGASSAQGAASGLSLMAWPKVDFAKFGPVESKPLSRIKKISGAALHRNWVMIPHVTNHEEADITELEAFRTQLGQEQKNSGIKVTLLAFLIKACASALKQFPTFNTSLVDDNLVYKQYYNIGFAADTPNGLVVPVIKNADQKGLLTLAQETAELAKLARDGKLKPEQMQGGCFSISSLGGIGGTHFTPIINAPEVAILGVCRSSMRAVWDGKQFVPRLILPLSLSYDHRVVDGAEAARFNVYLAKVLADFRRVLL